MITIAAKLLRDVHGRREAHRAHAGRPQRAGDPALRQHRRYGFEHVEVAQSKEDLRRILRRDYRGLIVSMIHKFDDIAADISTARRTSSCWWTKPTAPPAATWATTSWRALPNATYIGFTGTPIDRLSKGQGTFKVFGVDDPQGYLDKYSIAESIADGTTVPLNYTLAPSDLRVDRETLEREFLDLREAEGVSDLEELNAILEKAVHLKI